MRGSGTIFGGVALLGLVIAGCAKQTEVVSVRGGFQKIPGSAGGLYRGMDQPVSSWTTMMQDLSDQGATGIAGESVTDPMAALTLESSLRRVNPDQSITLISRAPRHVIFHLLQTLRAGEDDLLLEQVLSEHTRQSMAAQGRDPREAVEYLHEHQQELEAFFAVIPFGEQTPGILQQSIGRNMFRLQVDQARALGLRFDALDVIIEDRSYRLLNVH